MTLPAGDPRDHDRVIAIADVAAMLSVPMPTLRSWERRYGIPVMSRNSGKHRRYSQDELHALRMMRDEIARGSKASVAAASVRALLASQGPAQLFIEQVLQASNSGDTGQVRAELARAEQLLGLGECIDEVLMPAMRQIGQWWETGRCDIAQERLTTEAARSWLDQLSAFAPAPSRTGPILLACGPTDLHTLGLEALAALLRHQGWSCRVLGARTPVMTLKAAAQATSASGVVIVSHLASARQRALASVDAIVEMGIPVFYAGNAFGSTRSRHRVPGSYLGTRLKDASQMIDTALSPEK